MLDDDMIDDEFSLSKAEIKNQLNTLPSAVSYPYGAFNDNVIRCAGKHYKYGYITNNELLNLNQLDDYQNGRLLLSRINVTDKFPFELYFRINGFHSMIKSLFNKIIKAR
jgi:hypothetical protein